MCGASQGNKDAVIRMMEWGLQVQDNSLDRQTGQLSKPEWQDQLCWKKCVFAQPEGNRQSLDTEGWKR